MSSNSRAAEYRLLVEDVIAGRLLEEDEIMELRDMIKRAERRMQAKMPAASPSRGLSNEQGSAGAYAEAEAGL